MSVGIYHDGKLIVELSEDISGLLALQRFLLTAKFHIDNRDITLDNDLLNELVGNLRDYVITQYKEGSPEQKMLAEMMTQPSYLSTDEVRRITDFIINGPLRAEREYGQTQLPSLFDSREKIHAYFEKAAFPQSIVPEDLEQAVEEILNLHRKSNPS